MSAVPSHDVAQPDTSRQDVSQNTNDHRDNNHGTNNHSDSGSQAERQELLRKLRAQLGGAVALGSAVDDPNGEASPVFSTGVASLDRLLPGGGLQHGMLVEWLAELPGCGAATLGLLAAREACRAGGMLVVLDRMRAFYPPAAAAWGIDPARLLVVWPRTPRDEIWAAIQSLRSPVVAAMWTMIDRLESRNFRRLQLAAEAGRTLGVLVRGASARGQPSWADVRLGVGGPLSVVRRPLHSHDGPRTTDYGRSLQVSVLHLRGGRSGGSVHVEIDEAAHEVREARGAVSDRRSAVGQKVWPIAESRQPKAPPHVPHPLPVVAELADPAALAPPTRA
jgi:hypothetical protein